MNSGSYDTEAPLTPLGGKNSTETYGESNFGSKPIALPITTVNNSRAIYGTDSLQKETDVMG